MTERLGNRAYLFIFLLVFFLFSSGCAKKTMVVLLPDPDGKVGHVTVFNEAGSVDITQAAEATTVSGRATLPSPPKKMEDDRIAAEFSTVLATLPAQPEHFVLYFKKQSTELTDEATKLFPLILKSIEIRESQAISVIGHTDTAGNRQYNLTLSQKRAAVVSRLLVKQGVNQAYIKSTSHGEENPLIKTADNVNEPKNRRVEVVVR